jgi:hypothetical protein
MLSYLRLMSPLSGVLTEAWALYRRYAAHFLVIAFVVYLIAAVLEALLTLAGVVGVILGSAISLIATYVVQTALIKAVQDVRDGQVDLDLGQTVRAALPYLWPVIGASILAGIGITIGFFLLIVPGFILLTFWCLIVPFIVLGGSGAIASFGNSWRTVRGYAWPVFGTYVLVFLILIAFGIVLGVILAVLPLFPRTILNGVVSGTLVAPFLALVAALIYYRLTAAHAGQPVPGGPASTIPEPPWPTATPGSPGPAAPGGATAPYPTPPGSTDPGPAGQGPADAGPTDTPPDTGPTAPPAPPGPGG